MILFFGQGNKSLSSVWDKNRPFSVSVEINLVSKVRATKGSVVFNMFIIS